MLVFKGAEEAEKWFEGVSNDAFCQDWATMRGYYARGFGGAKIVKNIDANMKYISSKRGISCTLKTRQTPVNSATPKSAPPSSMPSTTNGDYQRLKNLNDYLQSLPGGLNHNQPKSCPWLASQSSDGMNTYCIYECTDGSTKTVTQIAGMGCI
ncbi:hypothetical protein PQZ40_01940 [Alphaproteobacteria bacterium]|nr:hypothetical protein [Alphaproteobacteria bacterium]